MEALCHDGNIRKGMLGEYHETIGQWQIGGMLFDEQDLMPVGYKVGEKVAIFSSIFDDQDEMQDFQRFQNQSLEKEMKASQDPFVVGKITKVLDNWLYEVTSLSSKKKSVYPWTLLSKSQLSFGSRWFYTRSFLDTPM